MFVILNKNIPENCAWNLLYDGKEQGGGISFVKRGEGAKAGSETCLRGAS